jgi:stage V sporulation protein R
VRDADLPRLEEAVARLWDLARAAGLDPLPTRFELAPAGVLSEIAAYGVPGRFAHWTHGKAYELIKGQYDLGLVKYFELVVNSDPAQAFLLDTNDLLTNKLVVAHVLGHTDFFRHNAHFRAAPRDVAERVRLHAERLRRYEFLHGRREVEACLDAVLAIEEHVDPWARETSPSAPRAAASSPSGRRFDRPYEDLFEDAGDAPPQEGRRDAGEEGSDLLLFLLRHAPALEEWERDVLAMVREESLYFLPQLKTKVMNEGWATLWHTRLLRQLDLDDGEHLDFARLNAAIRSPYPGAVNPYLLGVAIYEDLLERLGEEEGLRACLEIRECEDDLAFLRNHLTPGVAERLDLYVYQYRDDAWQVTARDFEAVREALLLQRVNQGRPLVVAADGDHRGARELYLVHRYDGRELDLEYAQKTLERIRHLWRRRVHLETVVDGQKRVLVAE